MRIKFAELSVVPAESVKLQGLLRKKCGTPFGQPCFRVEEEVHQGNPVGEVTERFESEKIVRKMGWIMGQPQERAKTFLT
ncbi:hypothetical protein MPTK1_1g20770 [Marchantia polymorpha subsp. ruderalis]|uniref:Uncharacterized protein n=2 Tax=Marchantia polymorpha TaxID=3197 RepID=A0AAF6ASE1_MARPO|nr:hypothetical protein MARPO_0001s0412 [Marchantia polymorpha]BBM99361.1 hypothetical protein Mp_1g20770 [Marchantia polymorpha subsp. ruderalis]|eukprot:PTQ50442.1 hypothetical protein MARPO_0001s0412 [Marchantia polymorpha]